MMLLMIQIKVYMLALMCRNSKLLPFCCLLKKLKVNLHKDRLIINLCHFGQITIFFEDPAIQEMISMAI